MFIIFSLLSALMVSKIANIFVRILKKIFLSPSSKKPSNSPHTLSTIFWMKSRGPSVWSVSSPELTSQSIEQTSASISWKREIGSFCSNVWTSLSSTSIFSFIFYQRIQPSHFFYFHKLISSKQEKQIDVNNGNEIQWNTSQKNLLRWVIKIFVCFFALKFSIIMYSAHVCFSKHKKKFECSCLWFWKCINRHFLTLFFHIAISSGQLHCSLHVSTFPMTAEDSDVQVLKESGTFYIAC